MLLLIYEGILTVPLIELRHGQAIPEKPDKRINHSNPHQSLILELERAYRFFNKRFAAGELPLSVVINVEARSKLYRGSTPEPPKIPSLQIQPCQERIQVDHLAAALERLVPVQQDVPPGRWRYPGDQLNGLGIATRLVLRQQVRQDC